MFWAPKQVLEGTKHVQIGSLQILLDLQVRTKTLHGLAVIIEHHMADAAQRLGQFGSFLPDRTRKQAKAESSLQALKKTVLATQYDHPDSRRPGGSTFTASP